VFIALALLGVGQINAFEDQRQRRHADLKACGFGGIADPLEGALFEPLVPDAKPRPVPEEYLALVCPPVEVDEQVAAEGIPAHNRLGEHRELVEPATHIRRPGVQEYSYRRWKSQHKPAWRKTEITLLNVLLSAAGLIRNVWPEENRSSKGA
jgi:hypothetical protein